jgi:Flp pilus assembly protein TadD
VSACLAAGLLVLLVAQGQPGGAAAPGDTWQEQWALFVRADAQGDAGAAERALREIRRSRMERNVSSLDTLGLALVERGVARMERGARAEAEQAFRTAVELAPGLPEGHAGLATALLRKGPLGVLPSIDASVAGLRAYLSTGRGALRARDLATAAGLLALFGAAWAIGAALLARHGGLLRHDIEEWLGPGHSPSAGLALFLLVTLLPVATFQGWGWLPLWWLALVYAYLDRRESGLALAVLAAVVAAGPLLHSLEGRLRTAANPLFHAALAAVETVPDGPAISAIERAARADPGDRDLQYLLAAALRRSGGYEDAAALYRRLLAADPADTVARNNLANIEFAHGRYEAARALYRAGTEGADAPERVATSHYNLSLVHLQKFEYQAYGEAKSAADRLAPGLVGGYDRWRYDSRDYAVVDLGLTPAQVRLKFAGAAHGVAVRNVLGGGRTPSGGARRALATRFAASVGALALLAALVGWWRGPKAFTLHCGRCGTVFCRSCHLGQVSGGLCSQCYHLFVVRDGVSGPARNRKMAEVQRASTRRGRVFRTLSVLSPGAGQIYLGWALRGGALVLSWYAVLGLLVAGRVVPLTEIPRRLSPPWAWVAALLALALVWVAANRFRPGEATELPARPAGPRRGRGPQAGG